MSTTVINLLVVFAGLATLALVLQAIMLIGILRRVALLSASLAPMLEEAGRSLPEFFRESRGLLRDARAMVSEARARIEVMASNLVDVTALARGQMERADEFLDDVRGKFQLQVERADEVIGNAIEGFETISNSLQRTVLKPIQDVHALIHGVRTGVDFFFRRRSSPVSPRPAYEDEEMFI